MLQSDNANKRYDACEELRVSPQPLQQEAIDALKNSTNDMNPDVADAARRALALHAPQMTPEVVDEQEKDKTTAVTTSPKTNKAIDFAIGFLCWLVIWNLLGPVAYFYFVFVAILELIGLVLPFALGRNWIGYGAVSYIITNAIVISVLSGEFTLYGLIIPFGALFLSQ